jgi:hypothetical protein
MPNPTDEVEILYTDLESLHKILGAIYNYLWAQDMVKSYQNLRAKAQESPLTAEVKRSRDKVFAYMHEAQMSGEESEED